jgi:hypothetical protein
MLEASIDIDSKTETQLYTAIFRNPNQQGNGTP